MQRVLDQKKKREVKDVQVIPFMKRSTKTVFRALNEEWISNYFVMEEADYKALDNPQEYILDKGGQIFVALYKKVNLLVFVLLLKCLMTSMIMKWQNGCISKSARKTYWLITGKSYHKCCKESRSEKSVS